MSKARSLLGKKRINSHTNFGLKCFPAEIPRALWSYTSSALHTEIFKWLSFAGAELSFTYKEETRHFIYESTLDFSGKKHPLYSASCCIQLRWKIRSQLEVFDFVLPDLVWVRGAEVQLWFTQPQYVWVTLYQRMAVFVELCFAVTFHAPSGSLQFLLLFLLWCCCRMRLLWTQETSFLNSNYIHKVYTHTYAHTPKHMHTFDTVIDL